jgi:integrase
MYELGLRLGEVLGLTNEDIVEKENGSFLYLRNRCSDSFYQLAKGCMKVRKKKKSIYSTKKYKTQGVGYHVVYLNDNLLEKINDYVNEVHLNDSLTFQRNYIKYTIADSVGDNQEYSSNFYLFINSIGRPLSANLWGKTLRGIFVKAGLDVDKEHREVNLSHRFRHGFAMFMVKYKKADILKLKELLRHKSTNSVYKYYRPTDKEIVEMKTEFVKSIYDVIPELDI